jgi:hypothetical protein
VYDDFDEFLKAAVREFYKHSGVRKKGQFIAFALASGESASLLFDKMKGTSLREKLIGGAVGAVAVRMIVKWALGGPLGVVLSLATLGSLIAYAVTNQKEIFDNIKSYREQVGAVRREYDEIHEGFRGGAFGQSERDLMIDGLLRRFVERVEQVGEAK